VLQCILQTSLVQTGLTVTVCFQAPSRSQDVSAVITVEDKVADLPTSRQATLDALETPSMILEGVADAGDDIEALMEKIRVFAVIVKAFGEVSLSCFHGCRADLIW
jgi:hypothetical protein